MHKISAKSFSKDLVAEIISPILASVSLCGNSKISAKSLNRDLVEILEFSHRDTEAKIGEIISATKSFENDLAEILCIPNEATTEMTSPNTEFQDLIQRLVAPAKSLRKDLTEILEFPNRREQNTVSQTIAATKSFKEDLEKILRSPYEDKKDSADWESTVQVGDASNLRRGEVIAMLREFESMWSGHLGRINATQHRIELEPNSRPVYQPPYRAGPFARNIEKREVEKMLRAGVIEPSMAEWASHVVLVPK